MSAAEEGHQAWEPLPRESGPAYEAFRVLLELGGGRTVAEVVRRLGKKESLTRVGGLASQLWSAFWGTKTGTSRRR